MPAPSLPDEALPLLMRRRHHLRNEGYAVMIIGDDCGASACWQALRFGLLRFQIELGASWACYPDIVSATIDNGRAAAKPRLGH